MATAFRNISSLTDDRASELIRADGVDVLVDLAGHTAGGRILLFARRLAPVQVTYLGYPNTTGLPSVDFRLTDAVADPPKMTDAFHSERLFRLAPSAWCYRPPPDAPPPAARRGAVTFGSFNNLAKVSNTSVELWARVLAASPGSRLLLKAKGLDDDLARRRLAERFASAGVDERRLALAPWSPSRQAHLSAYAEVDVALDTFPYHGTTTTCEALWMGVPVVVLEGRTHVSRVGSSLLSNAGVPGWVAKSPEAYVSLAVELARDRAADVEHRAALRARMARSRLLDEAGFARAFESALEGMYDEALERAGAQ